MWDLWWTERHRGRFSASTSVPPATHSNVFRARVRLCGICGGQIGTVACFLQVLLFPLPLIPPWSSPCQVVWDLWWTKRHRGRFSASTSFPPAPAPHSSSIIIRGCFSRPSSGRRTKWTRPHPTSKKTKWYSVTLQLHVAVSVVLFHPISMLLSISIIYGDRLKHMQLF
jgi:hypothetical protein